MEAAVYDSDARIPWAQVALALPHGVLLALYMRRREVPLLAFVLLNALQAAANFRVHVLKRREYLCYGIDVLIHLAVFYSNRTCGLFWNLAYVAVMAFVAARQRAQGDRARRRGAVVRVPRRRRR